jgi:hypothetical protein
MEKSSNTDPGVLDWTDPTMVEQKEANIQLMLTIWTLHENDIEGWCKMAKRAMLCDPTMGKQYMRRAEYSSWVRKIEIARAKFNGFDYDPNPDVYICSFAFYAQDD